MSGPLRTAATANRPVGTEGIVRASHVRLWAAVIAVTVLTGTCGYILISHAGLGDALYMTVITLTTVGYREVFELDGAGRAWTMLLAVVGVGIIFGTIGIVAEAFLVEAVGGRREQRRMTERVAGLRDHFILCGYGRVGATVARELAHSGVPFVVIDITPSSIETAKADGCLVVQGDATRDEVLESAGVRAAKGLITTVDSDAANVYVTLSARAMNTTLFIVARANQEGAEAKLLTAGADRTVSPYTRAGRQIAELAVRPRVADFLDFALSHGEVAFGIEEVEVAAAGPLDGRSLGELAREGIHAVAIVKGERDFEPDPPDDRVLAAGEHLIASGTAEKLRALRARA